MYEVIAQIIDHAWNTSTTGEQSYIYYICGCLIIVLTAVFVDGIFRLFRRFTSG